MNLNVPIFLDSKMIGIEKCETTTTMMMMINEVNTMTPRQNDLVVKKYSKSIRVTAQLLTGK